jgi:catechol 2,3-dioxygenase-like lactoylglutathione lyase family enzyme
MTRIGAGPVHGILHCNFNTADVEAAHDFYTGLLGMTRRMRTRSEDSDGAALGIEGGTTRAVPGSPRRWSSSSGTRPRSHSARPRSPGGRA